MSDVVEKKPEPVKATKIGEVIIEIGCSKNRRMLWPLNKRELRGRWTRTNLLGITMHASMQKMPDIPGIRIVLDCAKRTVAFVDPLNEPRNEELKTKVLGILKEAFRVEYTAEKDVKSENLSATDIKSHLYWMRRFVDNEQAVVVKGALPELEDIEKLEGKTMIQNFNSSQRVAKTLEKQSELDIDSVFSEEE